MLSDTPTLNARRVHGGVDAPPSITAMPLVGGGVRVLDVVDSHTCGQPTRVIISGAELTPGLHPNQARVRLRSGRDWVRRVAVFEPRGHRSMFAVAVIH